MDSNKGVIEQVEEAHSGSSRRLSALSSAKAHPRGDRALALIGNERITLTDEDVRLVVLPILSRKSLLMAIHGDRTEGYDEKQTKSSSPSSSGFTSSRSSIKASWAMARHLG